MKSEEFLNKKARELEYDDFTHYCDCRELEIMVFEIFRWMEQYAQSKMPNEDEIKKAAAKHEAAMRADYPNIKEDDWYWNYVNEDFEAGVEWVIKQIKSK